ncbi:MAG: 50S ribosomal protein L17 [Bacteroidetes bacterium]|nr:MAG: 50S ribosomal protein L17 [Bacteroidota bacterium]
MRHRKKFNHLGRKTAHRKAMLSNMAISLIEHKRINTTVAKAKALRSFVEPLINRSKDDTTHSRRMVFRKLQNKHAVSELFREISQKVAEREGGYTRILKTGTRLGDNAEMCFIELVDYNENYFSDKSTQTKKKRTRRGKTKVSGEETTADIENSSKVEEKTEEVKDELVEDVKETEVETPADETENKEVEDKEKDNKEEGDKESK